MEEEEQAGCHDRDAGKDAEGQQDIWESGCSVCGSSAGIHSWFHSVIILQDCALTGIYYIRCGQGWEEGFSGIAFRTRAESSRRRKAVPARMKDRLKKQSWKN